MSKQAFLGAMALLAMPAIASAVVLEGHFDGRADHNTNGPGVYSVGEAYAVYQTLNTTQTNPWYPWNGSLEYTAVFTTTVSAYDGVSNPRTVDWNTASLTIYEDNPGGGGTAADYTNTGTFVDGTAILVGTISGMHGQRINSFGQPWGVTGAILFTGGTGLSSLDTQCENGNMVLNDFINFQIPPGAWPDADGYEEGYDAEWKCPDLVGTEERTWGGVKASYR